VTEPELSHPSGEPSSGPIAVTRLNPHDGSIAELRMTLEGDELVLCDGDDASVWRLSRLWSVRRLPAENGRLHVTLRFEGSEPLTISADAGEAAQMLARLESMRKE
jgi:hypothetical protein